MIRLALVFLLVAAPALAADFLAANRGDWTGMGEQAGDTWRIDLQIVPGGARVDYPDLSCGGVWVIRTEGDDAAEGTEWLTYGHSACLDDLRLTLSANADGTLLVRWFGNDGTVIATAPLRRAGPPSAGAKRTGKKQ